MGSLYEGNHLILEAILVAFCQEFPLHGLNNQMSITAKYDHISFLVFTLSFHS